ncbi:NAD+ synthase [Bacteroidota bacterium]|nr:NAD+ synthase [Bacteroidota bacterium]
MRVRLAQMNPTVGDIQGNTSRIFKEIERAREQGIQLLIFPELAVCGYPPMDLLNLPEFRETIYKANETIIDQSPDIALIFGSISPNDQNGRPCYNSAFVVSNRKIIGIQHKSLLPNYDVFDDVRYFEPATSVEPIELFGIKWGVSVCEDIWQNDNSYMRYHVNPLELLHQQGAEIMVNISASPFTRGKIYERADMLARRCKEFQSPLLYVNQVGAQTELIFDGDSLAMDALGNEINRANRFQEAFFDVECIRDNEGVQIKHPHSDPDENRSPSPTTHQPETHQLGIQTPQRSSGTVQLEEAYIFEALTLGIRDYIVKSGLPMKVCLGLSGGIDSALVAALAVEALGSDAVVGVTMPSEYSSKGSVADSIQLAASLGIECHQIPINNMVKAFDRSMAEYFKGTEFGLAEENIQSRFRGSILMAWANKFAAVVLNTGNKSEYAVGYCTLYGDMNGALGVISDLYKSEVYALAEWMNEHYYNQEVIPKAILTKAPSAELRPDQKDSDSLPDYVILDAILKGYIEQAKELSELVDMGFDSDLVQEILKKVDLNEFKRYQSAPGLKVSDVAFGVGRRRPIVQQWTGFRLGRPF